MKKLINLALGYAIAAMTGGVFFREFTKFNHFTGTTALGKVHTHLFMLGMMMFLIAALFASQTQLIKIKQFKLFMVIYNIGVPLTASMMLIRGILQVLGTDLSSAADSALSGMAGIGHILTGTGIILFLMSLRIIYKNK